MAASVQPAGTARTGARLALEKAAAGPRILSPCPAAGVAFLLHAVREDPGWLQYCGRSSRPGDCGSGMSVRVMHAHHLQVCIALPLSPPVCRFPGMVRLSHPVRATRLNGRQGLCWPTKCTCGFNEGRTQLMVLHTAARLSRGSDSRCGVCWSTAIAPTHFTCCLCNILLACPACHKTSAWLRRHRAAKLGGARAGLLTCLLWCGAGGWGCFTACRGSRRS